MLGTHVCGVWGGGGGLKQVGRYVCVCVYACVCVRVCNTASVHTQGVKQVGRHASACEDMRARVCVFLTQSIGLALDGLQELLSEYVVGGVEGDGHSLAARGGHREGLCVATADDVDCDCHWEGGGEGGRRGGREGGGEGGREVVR